MEAITIRISEHSEGGYYYDIWQGDQISEDAPEDSEDGGICTTTMLNALGMAQAQAEDLIEREHVAKGHDTLDDIALSLDQHEGAEGALTYLEEQGMTRSDAQGYLTALIERT